MVAELSPADIGAGLVTFFPVATRRLRQPLLVVPRSEPVAFQLSLRGSIPDTTSDDWRRHYGPHWPHFHAAKHHVDPENILTPGQQIFPTT